MSARRDDPTTADDAPAPDRPESDEVAELLRDIEIAERQIAAGETIPHQRVREEILRLLSE